MGLNTMPEPYKQEFSVDGKLITSVVLDEAEFNTLVDDLSKCGLTGVNPEHILHLKLRYLKQFTNLISWVAALGIDRNLVQKMRSKKFPASYSLEISITLSKQTSEVSLTA